MYKILHIPTASYIHEYSWDILDYKPMEFKSELDANYYLADTLSYSPPYGPCKHLTLSDRYTPRNIPNIKLQLLFSLENHRHEFEIVQ